jgi:hemerythrin superfamily protein
MEVTFMSLHNAVAMIKEDHRRVESLYHDYQRLDGQHAEQRRVVEHICDALEIHARLEEDIFYTAIQARMLQDRPDLVEEALKEHRAMKRLIDQLQNGGLSDTDYDKTVHQLMRDVRHHIHEAEEEMLPRAEQQLGDSLAHLGMQMQQRKRELLAARSTAEQLGQGT